MYVYEGTLFCQHIVSNRNMLIAPNSYLILTYSVDILSKPFLSLFQRNRDFQVMSMYRVLFKYIKFKALKVSCGEKQSAVLIY